MIFMLYTLHGGSTVRVVTPSRQRAVARTKTETARVVGWSSMHPTYDGIYDVIPIPFVDQTLSTSGKVLRDDVTVHEIPYSRTSNESGGFTFSIAS